MNIIARFHKNDDAVTIQSIRSLQAWVDSRGPGEELSRAISVMLVELSHSRTVEIHTMVSR